jgi:hypothetical protein
MALLIGRGTLDADGAVAQMTGQLNYLYDTLVTFRITVVANTVQSDALQMTWSVITGTEAFVVAKIAAVGATAVTAAYQRKFGTAVGYDPSAQWATAKAAIDTLVTNLKSGMPKDASGRPVFSAFNGANQLAPFAVTLTGPQITTLTGNIDSVLAAFS